jgi:hypothetical protein
MATPETRRAFSMLSQQLANIGLSALFSLDGAGNPSGWLWNQIQSGIDTTEELMVSLQQTEVFRNRFSVIVEQQRRAGRGEPVYVMSPSEVIEYEERVKQTMKAAGMPPGFYDQPADFAKLILQGMSVQAVEQRVAQAYDYVQAAPPEVKAAFQNYFGVGQADTALAAWALDPSRTLRDINKATRTAYAGGMAQRYDVAINRATADRIGELGLGEGSVQQGMAQVSMQKRLYGESIGEATDITSDDAVSAIFDGDSTAQTKLNRRIGERQSVNRASTGGAAVIQQGMIGASSSE